MAIRGCADTLIGVGRQFDPMCVFVCMCITDTFMRWWKQWPKQTRRGSYLCIYPKTLKLYLTCACLTIFSNIISLSLSCHINTLTALTIHEHLHIRPWPKQLSPAPGPLCAACGVGPSNHGQRGPQLLRLSQTQWVGLMILKWYLLLLVTAVPDSMIWCS